MKKIYRLLIQALLMIFGAAFSVLHAADITTTAQGGEWGEKTTWVGGVVPTENDNVTITSLITFGNSYYSSTTYKMKNLTINSGGKLIREKEKAGLYMLDISGNLVNNGEIIDYKDYFDLKIYGNLVNNGTFKPRGVSMLGTGQKISGTHRIEAKNFVLNMTDNELVAISDVRFHNCLVSPYSSSNPRKLNMKTFSLHLSADSIRYDAYYGSAYTSCDISAPIIFEGTGTIHNENAFVRGTITGNVILKSKSFAFLKDLTVEGNLTFDAGAKISGAQHLNKVYVKGNFTNLARLNADTVMVRKVKFAPRTMRVYVYGNCTNPGNTGVTTVYPVTEGKEITVSGNYKDLYIMQSETTAKPGGKVLIKSDVNISGKLDVYADLEITPGGNLNLLSKTLTSPVYVRADAAKVINNGSIYRYRLVGNSWSYRSFDGSDGMYVNFELRDWSNRVEGVDITVKNNQTYPGLPGSVKRWWRITPEGTGTVKYYTLKLFYDESILNGQKEKNLKVYRTKDQGKTWEMISAGSYAVLDTIENSISIGTWNKNESMLTEFGDFVISSGDGSVPVESNILVDIVGRNNVRIGAPNPFTIHVYNITDYPTKPVMITLAVSEDVRFKEVRLPNKNGTEILPVDSISQPDDLTQVFFIPYLEPNEHYSFEVIVYGMNSQLKSASENLVNLTLGGFFGHVAEDAAQDYYIDQVAAAAELDKEEKAEYARGLGLTVDQLKNDKVEYGRTVTTIRHVSKYVVKNIADTNPVTKVLFKVGEATEAVHKVKDSLRRRLFHWFYKEVGLYGVEEKVASGKQVQGKLVSSWDPNEIVGPAGYGDKNYIATIPTMNYTIFFENKKEATAPAYRIQVTDTLSAVFDPETVKFGNTSHSGANYKWKMVRNGNILKWDIEGIELPPNQTPPEGEGFVTFSVNLIKGIQSGTEIKNRATIVFDMNPAIMTNTWTNVIDTVAPVTIMDPIKYSAGDSIIKVSCKTADNQNGSGPGRYGFYASVNNAPFQLIGESFENTINYPVSFKTKESYRFYALAVDNVENAESKIPQIVELKSIPLANDGLENQDKKLTVYPNPTNGPLTIDFFVQDQSELILKLYSASGELFMEQNLGLFQAGRHRANPDIYGLKPGMYLLKTILNNKVLSTKILKY